MFEAWLVGFSGFCVFFLLLLTECRFWGGGLGEGTVCHTGEIWV